MLRADYSIDCDAAGHAKYRYLAAAMAVVFPVGSLALYSVVLWRHRRLLHPPPVHGRPKEDKPIAEEAKRINAVVLRPLALLHDACQCLAVFTGVFLVLFDVGCLLVPSDLAVLAPVVFECLVDAKCGVLARQVRSDIQYRGVDAKCKCLLCLNAVRAFFRRTQHLVV